MNTDTSTYGFDERWLEPYQAVKVTPEGFAAAIREVQRLRARLSESEMDTKRLDWLQLHREDLGVTRDLRRGSETTYVECNVTGIVAHGSTLREAIDAAMAQEAK